MKHRAEMAGKFYPDDADELITTIEDLGIEAGSAIDDKGVSALIVPHAGYVYSGVVAAKAYRQIKDNSYDTIFLIGTSHKARFGKAALSICSEFETPLGVIKVNTEVMEQLVLAEESFRLDEDKFNGEHTLEVQLPFLQTHVKGSFKIVPILIGTSDKEEILAMAEQLNPWFNERNLFVVSTDFSHYPTGYVAEEVDQLTADQICKNNPNELSFWMNQLEEKRLPDLLTGLCGYPGIMVLEYLTQNKNYRYKQLLYQHSGMRLYKDTSRVVGYWAISVINDNMVDKKTNLKDTLLAVAHRAILSQFEAKPSDLPDIQLEDNYSGIFVSVYVKDELRGCIGTFESSLPILSIVRRLAVDAAFHDNRFNAIEYEDLDQLKIEVSLLSPLTKIESIDQIDMLKHGIYIKKGMQTGTFLPQVGRRNNWTIEEYLGYCAKDKAHIGWEGWKDAEIYTYESTVFTDRFD